MICPECKEAELEVWETEDGPTYPTCDLCGFVKYDDETLAMIAEAREDYERAKRECWPNRVPTYLDYMAGDRGESQ